MVTGDFHHTALGVARQVGMVQAEAEIVIIDSCKQARVHSELSSLHKISDKPNTVAEELTASPILSQEDSVPDTDNDLTRLTSTLSTRKSDLGSLRARLVNLERTPDEEAMVAGLRFVSVENNQELEQSQAVASLAEGQAQCAVTGAAFELLMQQQDLSLLEVVMRSAVVFARMQPQQKGQVMDLITMRGIHQMTASGSRYIPVSGSMVLHVFCATLPVYCMKPITINCP